MACKFVVNGRKSELYDKLVQSNELTALENYVYTKTDGFKAWFGNGQVDSNGEPVINDALQYTNEQGEVKPIKRDAQLASGESEITMREFGTQIDTLTESFKQAGVNVEVVINSDMEELGSVITINGKTTIEFNPHKAKRDTVFHEFGHILVDMLGDSNIIQRGIEHLRGTELEKNLRKLYPHLTEEQFGKELLTTAIGIEAAKINQLKARLKAETQKSFIGKIKAWQFWLNHFFDTLATKLGIGVTPAKRLAYMLTGGKLRFATTGKLANYKQYMKVPGNKKVDDLLGESSRLSLAADESAYLVDKNETKRMNRVTTVIDTFKGEFNRDDAVNKFIAKRKFEGEDWTREEVLELWADKREEGTGIHLISETYIKAIKAGKDRKAAIEEVLNNLYVPDKVGQPDKEGVRFYEGMSREYVEEYIDSIADFIDSLFAKGYKLYPEVKIFDEELGLAGTIDLLIEKPDGTLAIWDWKTKEEGKFNNFYEKDKYHGFEGAFSNESRSKANEYALQLGIYKLMLERKGYKVSELAIIPVVGNIERDDAGNNRYYDLHIDSQVDGANEMGVLPLKDFSEKLRDEVFLIKDDIETELTEHEETEETLEALAEQALKLHVTNEWITQTIIDIKKSISRIRATASVDDATRFEQMMIDRIKKLMNADQEAAIASYAKSITADIEALYKRLKRTATTVTNKDGSKSTVSIKGYETYTWQDIKLLEETDKEGYVRFLTFMINADLMISQHVKLQNLPNFDNEVFKAIKANEALISDIRLKLNRINRELDLRYAELSSNPLFGGRGVIENSEAFFKATLDEGFMQRNFDAMADTHNSYIANVMRMYDYKMRYYKDEVNKATTIWNEEVEALEKAGSSVDRMIDKENGRVIPVIDYALYFKNRDEMFKQADEVYKTKLAQLANTKMAQDKRVAAAKVAKAKFISAWFDANVEQITAEEKTKLEARKELELGKRGFNEWKKKQLRKTKTGTSTYSKGSLYYKPKASVYTNERYKTFSKAEKDFHAYLLNTMAYLTDHVKESIVKQGYLPAVPNGDPNVMKQFISDIGWRDSGVYDPEQGVIVNENGDVVEFLPFKFNNKIAQKKFIPVDEGASAEEIQRVKEENAKIREENKAAHIAGLNMNLKETMKIYINEALKHKHKKAMEYELLRVRKSFIENHKIQATHLGKPIKDKFKLGMMDNADVEKSTVGSNTLKHYEDWLKMVFYEEFEANEGNWQKVARVLQNFTSFKGMAFNIPSAVNNQIYGQIMNNIEGLAGQFFSIQDWYAGSAEYSAGIISYFADNEKPSTKQSAFIQYFNITMDFTERSLDENASVASRAYRAMGQITSKAYAFEHMSEHNIQNRTLFAMARSHKVVDGVIMDFNEYKRGKLKEISYKDDEAITRKSLEENKELLKTLEKEWESFTTVYDAFEFKDGKFGIKPELNVKTEEIAEFERKVLGVNQYMHGIYNKADAGAIQHYAMGRLVMQFRKWMRPGWNKRWGTRFGQSFWNERRSMKDEGMYITTMKFFGRPIIDAWNQYYDPEGTAETKNILKAFGNIVKGYGDMITRAKVHWNTLDDTEKANVTRSVLEYLTFCSAIAVSFLLQGIKGDDDDEEPNFALGYSLYQADRLATELTTFVPMAIVPGVFAGGGWLNESKKMLKSPAATFNTFESALKIGQQLVLYPFANEEDLIYKSGMYHGQNKLQVELERNIPIRNQIQRLNRIYDNYKHYKLF